jgi:hypothetical protein
VLNVVIDEKGKVRYYDIQCATARNVYNLTAADSPFPQYGKTIEKIVDESPDWLPAIYKGKNIKVLYGSFNVYFKPLIIKQMSPVK